jgi:hypothetical protein
MRPPLNWLEIAHTITHVPNRKKNTGERKTQCSWEMEVNIEDMEVDDVDQVPNRGSIQMVQVTLIVEELSHDGPTIFEEDSVLHHDKYDQEVKKLQIGRVNSKDEKVIGKWSYDIKVKGLIPSRVIRFHESTSDALDHSITEQELGDYKLKK